MQNTPIPCVSRVFRWSFPLRTRPCLLSPPRFIFFYVHVTSRQWKTTHASRAIARQLRLSPCSDIPPKVPHSFLFTKSGHQVTTHATLVIIDPSGRTTHLSAPEPVVSTPPPKSKASNSSPPDDEHRLVSGNASDDSSVPLLASPSLSSSVLGDTPPIGLVLPPGSVVTITNHALLCKNLVGFYY
jgi:hypothetical protein